MNLLDELRALRVMADGQPRNLKAHHGWADPDLLEDTKTKHPLWCEIVDESRTVAINGHFGFQLASFIGAALNALTPAKIDGLIAVMEAVENQRQYLLSDKCFCVVANEAGDRDICGRCVALDQIESALAKLEGK